MADDDQQANRPKRASTAPPIPPRPPQGPIHRPIFSDPPLDAGDEAYWLALPKWNAHELACLILGLDPRRVRPDRGPREQVHLDLYKKTAELVIRDEAAQMRNRYALPTDFVVRWVRQRKIPSILRLALPAWWPVPQESEDESAIAGDTAENPARTRQSNLRPSDARAESQPTPSGLSTGKLVAAFSLDSAWENKLTHSNDFPYTKRALLPDSLAGQTSKRKKWDPVAAAELLVERGERTRPQIDAAFRKRPELKGWLPIWQQHVDSQSND